MTRVNVFAAACCVAMMLVVSNVNAQCASCAQGVAPSFSQTYAAPVSNYAAPVYAQPQISYAAPVSTGCSSCGTANVAAPISSGCSNCGQRTFTALRATPISRGCNNCGTASVAPVSYAAPISSGCSSCGQATYTSLQAAPISNGCSSCGNAPLVSYAQPVSNLSVPVNADCATCNQRRVVRPQVVQRARVIGQRRGNNCNTCAPCNSCY